MFLFTVKTLFIDGSIDIEEYQFCLVSFIWLPFFYTMN